jgi:hypothetical protein
MGSCCRACRRVCSRLQPGRRDAGPSTGRRVLRLSPSPFGDPAKESFHPRTLAPHKVDKLSHIEIGRFPAEKCFQPPSYVRRRPRTQTISFGDDPVIPQCVQHSISPARPQTRITAPAVIPSAARVFPSFWARFTPALGDFASSSRNDTRHVDDRIAV